eukprot:COSAG01_NODE_74_length_28433_cov_41.582269_1_plen_186_part_00
MDSISVIEVSEERRVPPRPQKLDNSPPCPSLRPCLHRLLQSRRPTPPPLLLRRSQQLLWRMRRESREWQQTPPPPSSGVTMPAPLAGLSRQRWGPVQVHAAPTNVGGVCGGCCCRFAGGGQVYDCATGRKCAVSGEGAAVGVCEQAWVPGNDRSFTWQNCAGVSLIKPFSRRCAQPASGLLCWHM